MARYYGAIGEMWERLFDVQQQEGPEEAAALASRYAAELVDYVRRLGHRVL